MYYVENTILEIGQICVNVTEWPNTPKSMSFDYVEVMPAPYTDNDVSVDIDKETAIELIEVLENHFKIENKAGSLLDEIEGRSEERRVGRV